MALLRLLYYTCQIKQVPWFGAVTHWSFIVYLFCFFKTTYRTIGCCFLSFFLFDCMSPDMQSPSAATQPKRWHFYSSSLTWSVHQPFPPLLTSSNLASPVTPQSTSDSGEDTELVAFCDDSTGESSCQHDRTTVFNLIGGCVWRGQAINTANRVSKQYLGRFSWKQRQRVLKTWYLFVLLLRLC